jgi:hypothetical protein
MRKLFLIATLLLIQSLLFAQKPSVLLMDADHLVSLKNQVKSDARVMKLVEQLKQDADKLLQMKPVSVMDKSFTPVSGNKHDYMSQAPYFWYDSSKPSGLPYMRRDGERNPEILKITDRKNIGELENATQTLALAYYLTNNEKYSDKTASLLRIWFLNEATKMNPNLDYGQGIPGVNTGRGIGIIETIALTGIADAAALLQGSSSWTKTDDKGLKDWYAAYLQWLQTSKNGIDEHEAKNNHGTYYAMQVVDFALFTGNKNVALKTLEEAKERMENQIDGEGKMPLELERTNAKGYTTFNIEAWFKLATLAEKAGVDLWNYTTKKQSSIRKAVDWFAPYALEEKPWTYQQITPYKAQDMYVLLLQAAKKYKDNKYLVYAEKLHAKPTDTIDQLLYNIK